MRESKLALRCVLGRVRHIRDLVANCNNSSHRSQTEAGHNSKSAKSNEMSQDTSQSAGLDLVIIEQRSEVLLDALLGLTRLLWSLL